MLTFIEKIIEERKYPIWAHPEEPLTEHIEKCMYFFNRISEEKNLYSAVERYVGKKFSAEENELKEITKLVFQMIKDSIAGHDCGKITPEFQRKLGNSSAPKETLIDESAKHSLASAVIFLGYYYDKIKTMALGRDEKKAMKRIAKLLAYVISRHHSSFNCFTIDFLDGLKETSTYGDQVVTKLEELGLINCKVEEIRKTLNNAAVNDCYDYFFVRLIYSVLVSCDYYATTKNESNLKVDYFGNLKDIDKLIESYESAPLQKSIRKFERERFNDFDFGAAKDINELRSALFLEVERNYMENPNENIYFLKAPTGAGKSNIALNLGFHMIRNWGRKLFYIYPFNTLVEQNRIAWEKSFSEDMNEYISVVNGLTPIGNEIAVDCADEEASVAIKDYYQKKLLDRQFLNFPCVLSTHVTFFDILFGAKKESPFAFVQLSDAVVVLDEIQSYKNSLWDKMIKFLQAAAELMNMKIIIMSATLPDLTILSGTRENVAYLLDDADKYFCSPIFRDRVKLSTELLEQEAFSLEALAEHILAHHGRGQRVLVEFVYKKTADEFYHMLKNRDDIKIPVECITGDDSIAEREKIIGPIRDGKIKELILIATQVIEAGVDIDMDIGYKNISKLDSEEQFLGRINRGFKHDGKAYFFKIDDAEVIYKSDYRAHKSLTLKNPEMERILESKDFDTYYERVLKPIKLVSDGNSEVSWETFYSKEVKSLDFKKIAKEMELISEEDYQVDVFFCRQITLPDGEVLDGKVIWDKYRELLKDEKMPFAEKRVKLSRIRAKMNNFIYRVNKKADFFPNDQIGDLIFIEDGESYFEGGKLNRKKLDPSNTCFI